MKVAIIGRTEILYETIELLRSNNHEIVCILTAKEAPEYKRTALDFKNLAQQLRIPFAMGFAPPAGACFCRHKTSPLFAHS